MTDSGRKQIHLSRGAQHKETRSFLPNREDVLEYKLPHLVVLVEKTFIVPHAHVEYHLLQIENVYALFQDR